MDSRIIMALIGGALKIGGAILVCIGVKIIYDRKTQKYFNDQNYKKMVAMQEAMREAMKNHENKTDENQSEEAE